MGVGHPACTGDRPAPARAGRLLLGFAGAATVLVADARGLRPSGWALVVLAAAVLWAAGTVWTGSKAIAPPSPRAGAAIQLLASGLALLLIGFAAGEAGTLATAEVSGHSLAAVAYLIVVDSLAGFALYNWLLRSAPITLVSTYAYAVPIVACLVGVVALGEPYRPLTMVGMAAIVAAVAIEIRSPEKVDPPNGRSCTG